MAGRKSSAKKEAEQATAKSACTVSSERSAQDIAPVDTAPASAAPKSRAKAKSKVSAARSTAKAATPTAPTASTAPNASLTPSVPTAPLAPTAPDAPTMITPAAAVATTVAMAPAASSVAVAAATSAVSATPTSTSAPAGPQFYCALALPLGNMGYQARVAGLSLLVPAKGVTAERGQGLSKAQRMVLEGTGQAQLLPCQLSPHTQLSPRFLWKQGIDPYNLQHGLGVAEFLDVSSYCLQPASAQDVLVSFGLRHFTACNTMAVQNYMRPNFLTRFNYIVDLKVALFTCAYFGQQREAWQSVPRQTWGNLAQAATALGFAFTASNKSAEADAQSAAIAPTASTAATATAPASTTAAHAAMPTDHAASSAPAETAQADNGAAAMLGSESVNAPAHLQQRQKVTALSYVYRYLWQFEPKIMSFLQRSWAQRLKFVTQHQYIVSLDAKEQLCVLSVLAYDLKLRLVKAISCNGAELQVVVFNLDTAPLLAPISILTLERQQELHFDLTAVMTKLSQVDLAQLGLDPWPLAPDAEAQKYRPFAGEANADDAANASANAAAANVAADGYAANAANAGEDAAMHAGAAKIAALPPVRDEQVPLTRRMQQELYAIMACLSGYEGQESQESGVTSANSVSSASNVTSVTANNTTASGATSACVDYAYEAAQALAEVPPPQGVAAQAMGVFTVKELPFYQRYWLTMAAGYFAQWWQLMRQLESVQLSVQCQSLGQSQGQVHGHGQGQEQGQGEQSPAQNSSEMHLRLWSLLQPQTLAANAWGLQALGYAYDNVRALLDDGLLQRYSHYVMQLDQKRSRTWQQELQLLYDNLPKDDRYGAQLLAKIAAFLGMAS